MNRERRAADWARSFCCTSSRFRVLSASSAAIGKPAAVYELKDQDTLLLLLRAQRNW